MILSMKIISEDLRARGVALEDAFGGEVCNEARALRNLADIRLVDGRRKRAARNYLRQIANQSVIHSVDTATTIKEHYTLAYTRDQTYFFFRHNTAIGEFPHSISPAQTF